MRGYTQYDDESSDSDDEGWREAPSETENDASEDTGQGYNSQNNIFDNAPDRQPDDCWMLPSNSTEVEVLGPRCVRLEEIQQKTNAYVVFNPGKHQVDIWGDRQCIDRAKQFLDVIGHKINERKHPQRRTKKWEKPERELTEKEKRRDEKRQQRLMEGKSYQGLPTTQQPYNAFFPMPDDIVPLPKITGDKDAYLNQIRASCKTHIWYEVSLNAFRAAGQDQEKVREATVRLRQHYLRLRRFMAPSPLKPATLRLLYQPTKNIGARFLALPKDFVPCKLYKEDDFDSYRRLEPLAGGVIPKQALLNANTADQMQQSLSLIDLNEDNDNAAIPGQGRSSLEISERLRTLNMENAQRMETVLDEGLESLRLCDWEISMDVTFGQIYLLAYPKRAAFYTFSSEELAYEYFPADRFESKLAPCIGTTYDHVKGLLEYLSHHAEKYEDSPRTSYVIQALQSPNLPERPREDVYPRGRESAAAAAAPTVSWQTILTINRFTQDGHVGLWNCVTDCNTLVSINCANLEGDYSWETRLNYARRLPSDLNTPQGQFADHLRLSTDNRLVITTVPNYRTHIVKQLTKWIYAWGEYTVEVEKEEMWDFANMEDPSLQQASGLPLDLSFHAPHRVNYHVSMVRENWRDRFAENIQLEVGQAPTWTTQDFLFAGGRENTMILQQDAKKFADLLSSVLPVYYESRPSYILN